jgi:predicted  nucleic acid-binding Zn-ribbon protein
MFLYFRKLSSSEATQLKEKKLRRVASKRFAEIIREAEEKRKSGWQKLKAKMSRKPKEEDIWNIKVKDGVYEIDVASLMMKEPIIVAGEDGEYLVSLSSAFESSKNLKKYTELLRK